MIDRAIAGRYNETVYSERLSRDMVRVSALVKIDPSLQHDL